MISKALVVSVIEEYAEQLIKSLRLEGIYIDIQIISAQSKIGKKLHKQTPCVAFCGPHPYVRNGFTIVIFYDKQRNAKYTLETLIHELLHVKFRDLVEMVSPQKEKVAMAVEEKIVQDLERVIGALLT